MHSDKLDQPAFGAALRRARLALGLSQLAMASRVGLKQSTVSRIEQGLVLQTGSAQALRLEIKKARASRDVDSVVAEVASSVELRALVERILGGKDA